MSICIPNILTDFLTDDLSGVIQNTGLAFLTVQISLAIAVFTDVLQKRKAKDIEFAELDFHVILDEVFKVKCVLFYIVLIYAPLFFWGSSPWYYRLTELTLSILGIILLVKTIINVYRWTKGDAFKYRFSYLEKLKDRSDMTIAWRLVWQTENINFQDEERFFGIFSSKIDELLQWKNEDDVITISRLLGDFRIFTKNRSREFLFVLRDVFPKILEWHFKTWGKRNNLDEYNQGIIMGSIIEEIEKRALKEQESYRFFDYLKTHSDGKDEEYLKYLFAAFYRVFFDNIVDSPDRYDIWEIFPPEWKITKSNLENPKNIISKISKDIFLDLAERGIRLPQNDSDRKLMEVIDNLFPEVDPRKWARLLTFIYAGYEPDNRVKSTIERKLNFEPPWRVRIGSDRVTIEESKRTEELNTMELTLYLFGRDFPKDGLDGYIKEAEGLPCDANSLKEINRQFLLEVFKEMLKLINTPN